MQLTELQGTYYFEKNEERKKEGKKEWEKKRHCLGKKKGEWEGESNAIYILLVIQKRVQAREGET